MKWLFKWAFRLFLLLIVLVVVFILSLDSIAKALAERRIRSQTGMDVKIGNLSVGLLSPYVTLENFRLYNTAEFGGSPFIDIRELHLEYDRDALTRRVLRIKLVRFNLAEVAVVRNEAGKTNIVEMLAKAPVASGPKGARGFAERQLEGIRYDGIDVLNVTADKIKFVDLRDPRQNREQRLGIQNQVFKNVRTEEDAQNVLILLMIRSGGVLNFPVESPGHFLP
jgi:hypothetical protein